MRLDALYVDCCWALFAVLNIKSDIVTFAEFVKSDVDQRSAVKKQILCLAFATDEAKATIGELLDNTILRFY